MSEAKNHVRTAIPGHVKTNNITDKGDLRNAQQHNYASNSAHSVVSANQSRNLKRKSDEGPVMNAKKSKPAPLRKPSNPTYIYPANVSGMVSVANQPLGITAISSPDSGKSSPHVQSPLFPNVLNSANKGVLQVLVQDKMLLNNQIHSGSNQVHYNPSQGQLLSNQIPANSSNNIVLLQFTQQNSGLSPLARTSTTAMVTNLPSHLTSQGQVAQSAILQGHSQPSVQTLQNGIVQTSLQTMNVAASQDFHLNSSINLNSNKLQTFNFPDFSRPPPNMPSSALPTAVSNIPPPPLPPLKTHQSPKDHR
ncbi:hypothetical protein FSP39_020043 [Pinctada imbricata]|uniref:Uncharacterized protein n=1 Tax=Pinctada imbricata TaxID=66713 RepID=A0AA88Y8L3_PINIB|nr:hypothetical protein FSP39_020043 [Pinctada imbricata]